MRDLKLEGCKEKLGGIATEDMRAKIIWQWIKQDYITLKQFRELIKYV